MKTELAADGLQVHMVAISGEGSDSTAEDLAADNPDVVVLQDSVTATVWKDMGGGKDDYFIYGGDGKLAIHLPYQDNGTFEMDMRKDAGYKNVISILSALK